MKLRNEVQRVSSFKTVKRPVVKKRQENSKGFSFFSSNKTPKKPGLTLEVLQSLAPYKDGVDMATEVSRDLLMNCIKMEPCVHRLFFPEALKDPRLQSEDLRGFPLEQLSVAMVAEAMSKCNDAYKFHCTIERGNLEDVLNEIYSSVHWKKLGEYTIILPNFPRKAFRGISVA